METTIGIIGQRIKELRQERRLTLEEVAEISGCSAGFLSQLERNRAAPSISMLYSIAGQETIRDRNGEDSIIGKGARIDEQREIDPLRFEEFVHRSDYVADDCAEHFFVPFARRHRSRSPLVV